MLMNKKGTKLMRGQVIRRSGDKTVVVAVNRVEINKLYQKRRTRTKNYLTHDPNNAAEIGSQVTIREVRPLSARKRWIIVNSATSESK